MAKSIIPYPCEIKVGDIMLTKDQREREIFDINGRYIVFTDGSQFSFTHPDLVGVVSKTTRKKSNQKKDQGEE